MDTPIEQLELIISESDFDDETVSKIKEFFIPPDQIEQTEMVLGKGAFGIATQARYRGNMVCVKTCIPNDVEDYEIMAQRRSISKVSIQVSVEGLPRIPTVIFWSINI